MWIFSMLQECIALADGPQPEAVMADGDCNIHQAFLKVWPKAVSLPCVQHLTDKNLRSASLSSALWELVCARGAECEVARARARAVRAEAPSDAVGKYDRALVAVDRLAGDRCPVFTSNATTNGRAETAAVRTLRSRCLATGGTRLREVMLRVTQALEESWLVFRRTANTTRRGLMPQATKLLDEVKGGSRPRAGG
jgi:hypothetical protein